MEDAILVIGAGIAGISCALNAAEYGTKVYLTDNTPSIGGMMARLDKTFPTNDCSICIEAPQMYEVNNHPNIEIITNTELRKVTQKKNYFEATLLKKARFVNEKDCTGCGDCIEACPVTVPQEMDKNIGGTRKLIYMPFPQAIPNSVIVDSDCRSGNKQKEGACIGGCTVDCNQCRECPIALCVQACQKGGKNAIRLWQRNKKITLNVKSIVVATGIESEEPHPEVYGYKQFKNVITNLEFERLMNAGGPTKGQIIRPSDKKHAHNIAWFQCVNRGINGTNYCSNICCMIATKQAIITKEHDSEAKTTIFYNNLKTYGKGFWEFHNKAKKQGIDFTKGKPYDIKEISKNGNLQIKFENIKSGKIEKKEYDMLVLSMGLKSSLQNKKIAKILNLKLNKFGFFKEKDSINAPFETNIKGVYLCGGATGPVDISESVIQGTGASIKAILTK